MKPHIYTSEDSPAQWTGGDLMALCGVTVRNAKCLAAADSSEGFFVNTVAEDVCHNCIQGLGLIEEDSTVRRWEYVITEGQEALDEAV